MKRLDEIKERCEMATEGPWDWKDRYDFREHVEHRKQGLAAVCENLEAGRIELVSGDKTVLEEWAEHADDSGIEVEKSDAQFIANARSDVPWLVEKLEEAVTTIKTLDYELRGYIGEGYIRTEALDTTTKFLTGFNK